ncbi:MAG: hypothetical protein WBA57_01305 [Elainellaceae cyanobacterium]
MAPSSSRNNSEVNVRLCNYRDLDDIETLTHPDYEGFSTESLGTSPPGVVRHLHNLRRWYAPFKLLTLFPNPLRHFFSAYVAESQGKVHGLIQVAPFNRTLTTWRIERIAANAVKIPAAPSSATPSANGNGTNGTGTNGNGASAQPGLPPNGAAAHAESATASANNRQTATCEAVDTETAIANGRGKADSSNNGNGSAHAASGSLRLMQSAEVASHLLRYCLTTIWEARTWLVEVGVNDKDGMGLYRQNGFQPLAQITYWKIIPDLLSVLAEREADLPNLRPVSNSDASLLHQLDTVSMPPLVRQVFDRHISDFKRGPVRSTVNTLTRLFRNQDEIRGYVFEPQRKAAIGHFQLHVSKDGRSPHQAHFTVHPAYTWLYPEMLSYMARLLQDYPPQGLEIASSDYQPEREEYLEKIGAERTAHNLMMSRSVWHKVRETRPMTEGLQLSEVLQGLQPSRKPVPGRFSWISPMPSMPPHELKSPSSESQNAPAPRPQPKPSSKPSFPQESDHPDSAQWPQDGAT